MIGRKQVKLWDKDKMKIEELYPMVEVIPNDIQSCHDRIESLEDRIQIAKELLLTTRSEYNAQYMEWCASREQFIAKLESEGL